MTDMNQLQDETKTKVDETDKLSLDNKEVVHETANDAADDNFDGVIDLTATRKKRFHVNRGTGAEGVLELNTSDMSVITRLEDLYPKLEKLGQEASLKQVTAEENSNERMTARIAKTLEKIDSQMREIVDEIFDSNVSEICAPDGSMFDPFNGEFRYEHIISTLSKLYEGNISAEFTKMSDRIKKRTSKYTKGR